MGRLEDVALSGALEAPLAAIVEAGRAAWPRLPVDPAALARHLGARLADEDDPAALLPKIHAADLHLAFACATGSGAAVAAFDATILRDLPAMLGRLRPTATFIDDVRAQLSEKLFVAAPGSTPKIADYSGRG